ncbi:hypothetical protein WEN_03000 [Mycoplasma wenyonii str. Massachusetts]|uniref:Uncharacterized protein n=1 Tax=Mycoplasma wenyonii (strain Massachusetts) TaxID=1197325 RepID=I6Z6Z0_MYCWM|nr:hypothetical protein [Mycoplasma wenyonii]AFN65383.1 hypothetical protein WEN_03000 [Mycoplasma wenyonii str. Massachusetts]
MAVSHIVRVLQIFAGSGAIAVVPFSVQFANKQSEINLSGDQRPISDDNRQEPQQKEEKPVNTADAVLKEAVKRLENEGGESGKTGCFWLPARYNRLDLFMCVNTQTLKPLTLFHYDWKVKNKSLNEKLNEVVEVTYHSSFDIKMKFQDGKYMNIPRYLTSSFAWLRGWGESMKPREHCSLSPKSDGSNQHRLSCRKEDKKEGFNDGVNPELTNSDSTKLQAG